MALIYLSYIKKQMLVQMKGLFKNYTLPGLLDKLDVIECVYSASIDQSDCLIMNTLTVDIEQSKR